MKIKHTYAATLQDCTGLINEKVEERLYAGGRLGDGYGGGSDKIFNQVGEAIEGVKAEHKNTVERLNELSGKQKGLEDELDNLISIKISNESSSLSKSLNDKLRQINQQYIDQTKDGMDGILERVKYSEQVVNEIKPLQEK